MASPPPPGGLELRCGERVSLNEYLGLVHSRPDWRGLPVYVTAWLPDCLGASLGVVPSPWGPETRATGRLVVFALRRAPLSFVNRKLLAIYLRMEHVTTTGVAHHAQLLLSRSTNSFARRQVRLAYLQKNLASVYCLCSSAMPGALADVPAANLGAVGQLGGSFGASDDDVLDEVRRREEGPLYPPGRTWRRTHAPPSRMQADALAFARACSRKQPASMDLGRCRTSLTSDFPCLVRRDVIAHRWCHHVPRLEFLADCNERCRVWGLATAVSAYVADMEHTTVLLLTRPDQYTEVRDRFEEALQRHFTERAGLPDAGTPTLVVGFAGSERSFNV